MEEQKVSTEILLDGARRGRRTAIGHVIAIYEPLIEGAVRRHLGPRRFRAEGEDLLQSIRLKLVKGLPALRGTNRAALIVWMRRTIEHEICDWEKSLRARRRRPAAGVIERAGDNSPPLAASSSTPSQILLRREEVERLRRAIEGAPERYRDVLRFVYQKSPTLAELAAFTGKSPEAASKFVARALAQLRAALEAPE